MPGDGRVSVAKEEIRAFWDGKPCGSKHAGAPEGTPDYFAQVESRRQELEPFIDGFADFGRATRKRVLEIGVGLGTDFVRFARAGAIVTGVDLSPHAVELVRQRLEQEGLEGRLEVADAEHLPFPDGNFERVYSWGVLHHAPDTRAAAAEAIRVLAPGGELCAMLYARHSWFAYAHWVRFALLTGRVRRSLADVLANHLESKGTQAFTEAELREMFAGLEGLRIERPVTPYDRRVAGPLARLTSERLGWFAVVRGNAPRASASASTGSDTAARRASGSTIRRDAVPRR
jgi:ubiquinone/menaquinone biosynthesis C-methylase UbiE